MDTDSVSSTSAVCRVSQSLPGHIMAVKSPNSFTSQPSGTSPSSESTSRSGKRS